MKFKIDENLPVELAELVPALGHVATTVFEQRLQGKPDNVIWNIACGLLKKRGCAFAVGMTELYHPIFLTRAGEPRLKIDMDICR